LSTSFTGGNSSSSWNGGIPIQIQGTSDNNKTNAATIATIGSSVLSSSIPAFYAGAGNGDTTIVVEFVVASVPDSVLQFGPFSNQVSSGRLISPVLSVTPSSPIRVNPEATANGVGIFMSIMLTDQGPLKDGAPSLSNEARCKLIATRMSVYSFQNENDGPQQNATSAARCIEGVLLPAAVGAFPRCACKFLVPHFSSFGVVDDSPTAPAPLPPGPPTTNRPSSPPSDAASGSSSGAANPGVIAGSVVGAIAFVGMSFAAYLQRDRIRMAWRKWRGRKEDAANMAENDIL